MGAILKWGTDQLRGTGRLPSHVDVRSEYTIPAVSDESKNLAAGSRFEYLAQRKGKNRGDHCSLAASFAGIVRIHRNRRAAQTAPGERFLDAPSATFVETRPYLGYPAPVLRESVR